MLPDKIVGLRVPPDLHRRYVAEARRQGRTTYALMREILVREGLKLPPVLLPLGEDDPISAGKFRFAG